MLVLLILYRRMSGGNYIDNFVGSNLEILKEYFRFILYYFCILKIICYR